MSTTATASADGFELGVDPAEAFDELAFKNPEVCSRCFCHIRTHDTYRPDVGFGGVSKHAPTERLIRAFDGEKGYKTEIIEHEPEPSLRPMDDIRIPPEDYVYGYRPLHEPRTFCSDCGSQSGRADDDDLPRRLAVIFAANLANRLHEAGVTVDTDELKRAIGLFKSREDLNGCDTEIFRRATKIVIKRARRRRL